MSTVLETIVAVVIDIRHFSLFFLFIEHHCPSSEENGREETINSPIRVSPQRDKSRRSKEDSHKTSFDRKLSVKERLYVSRQTIGL